CARRALLLPHARGAGSAPRRALLPVAGRERPDRGNALDLRRARLSGRRAGAQLPQGRRARGIRLRDRRRRARGLLRARAHGGDPPRAGAGARDRVAPPQAPAGGKLGARLPLGPRRQGPRDRAAGARRRIRVVSEDDLRASLRGRLDGGGRVFVPYVTGGLPSVDAELLRGVAKAGADAIEVGIPFSDPVIDGGVIQTASRLALEAGATPGNVLETIAEAAVDVPVVVMTYLNPVHAHGEETFLREAVEAGVSGVIVPDLPVDEAAGWIEACSEADVAPVFLAAPGTSEERLREVAAASRGFVYCVATYGVT